MPIFPWKSWGKTKSSWPKSNSQLQCTCLDSLESSKLFPVRPEISCRSCPRCVQLKTYAWVMRFGTGCNWLAASPWLHWCCPKNRRDRMLLIQGSGSRRTNEPLVPMGRKTLNLVGSFRQVPLALQKRTAAVPQHAAPGAGPHWSLCSPSLGWLNLPWKERAIHIWEPATFSVLSWMKFPQMNSAAFTGQRVAHSEWLVCWQPCKTAQANEMAGREKQTKTGTFNSKGLREETEGEL